MQVEIFVKKFNLGGGHRRCFCLAGPSQQKGTCDIFTKISASEHVFSDHNRQAFTRIPALNIYWMCTKFEC
jgi:hypothetical protein